MAILMKYLLQIGLISYLFAGEIQTASEEFLFNEFSDSISIKMYTFDINKKIKKVVGVIHLHHCLARGVK